VARRLFLSAADGEGDAGRQEAADREGLAEATRSAVEAGHLSVLEVLLSQRLIEDIDVSAEPRKTQPEALQRLPLLHWAAGAGHMSTVELLASWRAELNMAEPGGEKRAPIHFAAFSGYAAVVTRLVALRANPAIMDANGLHAVEWAAWQGHLAVVKSLVAARAGAEEAGPAAGRLAANGHVSVMTYLISQLRGGVHAPDNDGTQPLHLAAVAGHGRLVALLLRARADALARDASDATPIHFAAAAGHGSIAAYLIARRAETEVRDARGLRPADAAALAGHRAAMAACAAAAGVSRREL